jgi:hypothetical protein
MPTLMASVSGSVAGWLVGEALQPYLGVRGGAAVSLVTMGVVFWAVRKWLRDLRDG